MKNTHQGSGNEDGAEVKTHVIGSRDKEDRPLFRLLENSIITINTFAMVGVLGLAALHTPLGKNAFDEWIQRGSEIPASVESISWVDLEQTPFMKAGFDEDGGYDLYLLFERWVAAGIPLEDFDDVLALGQASSPLIMGTDDKVAVARHKRQAKQANAELKERWPQAHALLEDENWLGQHTYVELDDQTWEVVDQRVADLINDLELDVVSGPDDYLEFDGQEQARGMIESAVEQTGVRSLRLSNPAARDPYFMGNTGYKLIQLNEKLRARTNWDGAVLGLGGRIDWELGTPENGASGVTTSFLNANKDHGQLGITSGMAAAPHEWWHGYEIVSARMTLASTDIGTITSQLETLQGKYISDEPTSHVEIKSIRVRNHHDVVDLLVQANDNIIKDSPEWIEMRHHIQDALKRDDGYMLRGEEILASAFSGQIYTWDRNTAMEPGRDDAQKHALYFDAIFRASDEMNLDKRAKRSLVNTGNWDMKDIFKPSVHLTPESFEHDSPVAEAKKRTLGSP